MKICAPTTLDTRNRARALGAWSLMIAACLLLTACASAPRQPTRVVHPVYVFSDSALLAERASTAIKQLGYTTVYVQSNPNASLNVKWGNAPDWMVYEIGAAVAQVAGEDLKDFQGMPIFDADDPKVFVNLPTRAFRRAATEERTVVPSRLSTPPAPVADAAPAPNPRPAAAAVPKAKKPKPTPKPKARKPTPVIEAPKAETTTGPFEHHEPGGKKS